MTYGPQHITTQILSDLDEIIATSTSDLEEIVNKPLVITGASGFVGTWLTLSWVAARKKLNGSGKLLITSRNPQSLLSLVNIIDSRSPITALSSDIRNLHIPSEFRNGNLIHAATPASATLNLEDPLEMLNVIMEGQGKVLIEAKRINSRVLFLSSGAIYGKQPLNQAQLPEDWNGGPSLTDTYSAYHEGKRIAELMGNIAVERAGVHVTTARLFAFIAPFLPFGTHFAAGNFMRDALESSEIVIKSGGGSIRSYQYATDLCSSLWALAVRGNPGAAYNVGSDKEISIRELAEMVIRNVNPNAHALVKGTDTIENVSRYVPSIRKITDELNVKNYVNLEEAIRRTSLWSVQSMEEKNK